jgi:hypothetical protein
VRTNAGQYYKEFLSSSVICIGLEKIKLSEILTIINDEKRDSKKELIKIIKEKYPENERPGLAAAQVIRFVSEISPGDVVIIPSESSSELSFGIVEEGEPFQIRLHDYETNKEYTYDKARKVTWVKSVGRSSLNPKLFSLFFAHQAISNGNDYAQFIDSTINDFYQKDGKLYLQLKILKKAVINARQLFHGCLELLNLTDDFLKINKCEEDTSDIDAKISLNSPGVIELIANSFYALTTVGLIIVAVTGGKFKAKHGESAVEFQTDGIVKKISDFLNEKHRRKELSLVMEKLEAVDPKDLASITKKMIK